MKRRITDFFAKPPDKSSPSQLSEENEYIDLNRDLDSNKQSEGVEEPAVKSKKTCAFQSCWMKDWPWLSTNEKGEMLCKVCIKSNMKNTFTSGCTNFRTSTLSRHAETKEHLQAVVANTQSKSLEKSVMNVLSKQESAVISAIDTVYWLAKENIALEKYGSLLELLDRAGCENVKNLNVAGNASYRSRSIAEEMQQAIADTIMTDILEEMKSSSCVAVMTDESTDISVKGKLIVYVRFINKDFQLKSHFIGNFDISVKDATTITHILLRVLSERGVPAEKILCLGSDGASVMTGVKNGVAAQLRKRSPFLLNIHCVAHRLALCTSQAASKIDLMQQYKTVLTNLYYYFKASSVRSAKLAKLQELLDQPIIKVREMHDIRWFSFYNVLEGIYKSWSVLIVYFDSTELSKDPKATGLRKSLIQYKFPALTWFLMDVIPIVTALNLVFQKESLDVAIIKPIVASTISKLEYLKTADGHYTKEFKSLIGDGNTIFDHDLQFKTQQEAAVESTKQMFIDNLITNLNKRFPSETVSVVSAFDALAMRDISFVSDAERERYGTEKISVLTGHYGNPKGEPEIPALIEINATENEYSLLKALVLQQRYPRDNFLTLWQIIFKCHKEQFPNLIRLATIALTLPVQTAICERGFSNQNLIKTAHRNRLSENALQTLMVISLEGPPLKEFKAEKALQEFKTKKARRIFTNMSFK